MDEWIEALVRNGWVLTFQSTLDEYDNSIVMGTAVRGGITIRKHGWNTIKLISRLITECAVHTPALNDEY